MAVGINNLQWGAVDSLTLSYTVPSVTDGVLIAVVAGQWLSSQTVTGVTYDGVSMTKILEVTLSSGAYAEFLSVWRLDAPTAGTADIVATGPSGGGGFDPKLCAWTLDNVESVEDSDSTTSTIGGSIALSLAFSGDGLAIGMYASATESGGTWSNDGAETTVDTESEGAEWLIHKLAQTGSGTANIGATYAEVANDDVLGFGLAVKEATGGGGVSEEASVSFGASMGETTAGGAASLASAAFGASLAKSASASANTLASASFGVTVAKALSADVSIEAAITFGTTHGMTAAGQSVVGASAVFGVGMSQAAAAVAVAQGQVVEAFQSTMFASAQHSIEVGVSFGIELATSQAGQAAAGAAANFAQQLATSIVGQALAEAGVDFSNIHAVTVAGDTAVTVQTPAGRVFRVHIPTRTRRLTKRFGAVDVQRGPSTHKPRQ